MTLVVRFAVYCGHVYKLAALIAVGIGACATTSRPCPVGAHLANEDRPTGRVEWCATAVAGFAELPVEGRTYPSLFDVAHPSPMSGGLQGEYTHWYPNGAVESHGEYLENGAVSVPNGLWAFWYDDGRRKSIGRYDRGQPVGCFAVWDERGGEVTGVVEGDQIRVGHCDPPADGALAEVETRSHPRESRDLWGDITLHSLSEAGTFGVSNSTQVNAQPSATETVQIEVRKYLGSFRVGPVLGYRMSDSDDDQAFALGGVAAYAIPMPITRFGAEIEAQLGIQYFDLTARRADTVPTSSIGLWAPLGGGRFAVSFAITPTVIVVGGVSVDGSPSYKTEQPVQYYLGVPVMETWTLGGVAYGFDVGLRLTMR